MISTAADLNRFHRALLTGRLLRPALLAEMQRTVPIEPAAPEAGGYGLGISWLATPCGRVWGHSDAFLTTALCGPQATAGAAGAMPALRRMADLESRR